MRKMNPTNTPITDVLKKAHEIIGDTYDSDKAISKQLTVCRHCGLITEIIPDEISEVVYLTVCFACQED